MAALFGLLLGLPVLRVKGDYLAIVTLGFGEIIRIIFNNLDRPVNITNGAMGLSSIQAPSLFGYKFAFPNQYYFIVVFILALVIFNVKDWSIPGSGGLGRRSGRTKSPPSRWACR